MLCSQFPATTAEHPACTPLGGGPSGKWSAGHLHSGTRAERTGKLLSHHWLDQYAISQLHLYLRSVLRHEQRYNPSISIFLPHFHWVTFSYFKEIFKFGCCSDDKDIMYKDNIILFIYIRNFFLSRQVECSREISQITKNNIFILAHRIVPTSDIFLVHFIVIRCI